jgi:L-iditol 2-dehydrogenase
MGNSKMKAAVLYGVHDVRVEEADMPILEREDEVIVKLKATGVCPTDVRKYSGLSSPTKGFPAILGHEGSGVVAKAGEIAKKYVNEGQRVAIMPDWPCGYCESCRLGKTVEISVEMCENIQGELSFDKDGTFAEYVKVPYNALFPIPENVSFEEAALVEPVACCLNAVEWGAQVTEGQKVLIIGSGFMGVATAQLCKIRGASVIISDMDEVKLKAAKEIGADIIVNINKENLEKAIKDFTNGKGVDSVIVAVGGKGPLEDALMAVRKGGRIVLLGSYHPPIKWEIDPNFFHYNMVTLTGIEGYSVSQFQKVISLISMGIFKAKPLISDIFKLEDIEKAFKMVEKSQGLRKVIVFD